MFKAPLAYSSSFYFVCRKDGMERKYMMYEGEDGNSIDLLYESPTKERNGVKIIIPINISEKSEFVNKIKEQLAYFENVYFNVPGIENDKIKITRNEHFQHSTLVKDDNQEIHICLDNVYYPIDYQKLGINSIKLNLGLRFSLSDGLFPTPNRESLRYTKEAKETILNRIAKVADYLVEKYNSTIIESDDVMSTLPKFGSDRHHLKFELGEWAIDNISPYASINFKLPTIKGVEISDLKRIWNNIDYLLKEYTIKYEYRKGRFKAPTNKYNEHLRFDNLINYPCYKFEDKLDNSLKRYFREHFNHSSYFIKRETPIKLGKIVGSYGTGYDNYIQILDLKKYPKKEWRKRIQECQFIMSKVFETFKDADKYPIPADWFEKKTKIKIEAIAARKERVQKLSGEVSAKELQKLDRYVDKNRYAKTVPVVINLEGALKYHRFTVYGNVDNLPLLEQWYSITNCSVGNKFRFLVFSERELKKIKDIKLHNWIKIEDFMKGNTKPFKRIVTAEVIHRFINKYNKVFDRKGDMSNISKQLGDKMELLQNYVNANHVHNGSEELYNVILLHAQENNLFDQEIYSVYKELNTIFSKLPFLIPMFSGLNRYAWSSAGTSELLPCIKDLFKYYKQRMNWENYVKLNEETENVEETEVTNELVEQSI